MFLHTDKFTSSVRIEVLFDTCFTLSWPKIFFASPVFPSCFLEISDGLLRCCVTSPGSPLAIGGLGFYVETRKLLSCLFLVVITLTKCL